MPDPLAADRRDMLLAHLDSVYTLAQAVAANADQAMRLVEDTYTQAFVMPPLGHTVEDDKRWLLQLLMHVHHERDAAREPGPEPDAEAVQALRRRLAEEVAERAIPHLFVTLPAVQRLLLLLCDVEDLSCADAARVLDLDAEEAGRLLQQARARAEAVVFAAATTHERPLLATSLPEGWLKNALSMTVEAAFQAAPPSMRPTLAQAAAAPAPPPADPPLPARPAEPADAAPRAPGILGIRLRRLAFTVLLVLAVGLVGYFASQSEKRKPETNVITLSVEQAGDASLTFPTSSPEQAEEFVRSRLGWRLTLPEIGSAVLTGVGIQEPVPGVKVPVFLYEDTLLDNPADQPVALYAYSYALLDRYEERLQLEPGSLRQIQEEKHFDLHDLGERKVLIWRNRDDIYVAVTTGDPESLQQRIQFPS